MRNVRAQFAVGAAAGSAESAAEGGASAGDDALPARPWFRLLHTPKQLLELIKRGGLKTICDLLVVHVEGTGGGDAGDSGEAVAGSRDGVSRR